MATAKDPDPKIDELRKRGCLHQRPELVIDELFATHEFFDPRDAIQVKYEMLRRVRIDGQAIARTARDFACSRPTFYEAKLAFDQHGMPGLLPHKKGPRRAHKLSSEVMEFIAELLSEEASLRAAELVDRIHKRFELHVHPRSVERALARKKRGS